jgi:EAL domain-containing protein (putative c-di-GMP-specific phosphodiesterase class I)
MSESLPIFAPPQTASPAKASDRPRCGACRDGQDQPFAFSMAFQPIVDTANRRVFAYEALVRGPQNQSAASVLGQLTPSTVYAFDQSCRVLAITRAAALGVAQRGALLSLNFMPGAVYSPSSCIQRTLRTAEETGFPISSLIFEITEAERVKDHAHLQSIARAYRRLGFTIALDDFGAGFSGLNLLAELDVQNVKLDARLVRDIDTDRRKREIVCSMVRLCHTLGVTVIGEAVETVGEYKTLRACGVTLMQGYLFARPAFEALPEVNWPEDDIPAEPFLAAASAYPEPIAAVA